MTTEHAIARIVPEDAQLPAPLTPREVIAVASEWAKVLMEIVNKQHLYAEFSGKKYLEAEAWEIIMSFDKATPDSEYCREFANKDGDVLGYVSKVNIMKAGEVVSSGIMSCGFDDYPCKGKNGTAKVRAAQSASQTWALAKAARMRYAWVAQLAGFAPTPANEMSAESQAAPEGQQAPRAAQTTRPRPAAPSAKAAATADTSAALVAATDDFYKATSDWTNEDRTAFIFSNFAAKWAELSVEQRRKAIGLISTLPVMDSEAR